MGNIFNKQPSACSQTIVPHKFIQKENEHERVLYTSDGTAIIGQDKIEEH